MPTWLQDALARLAVVMSETFLQLTSSPYFWVFFAGFLVFVGFSVIKKSKYV